MKRLSSLALALALALPVLGCRATHLGPNTGYAYRDALSSQRNSEAPAPAFDADDAHAVLKAHRAGDKDAKARSTGRGTSSSSSSSAPAAPTELGGAGSANYGPSGRQIRLDAK